LRVTQAERRRASAGVAGWLSKAQALQIAITKAVQGEFTATDRLQQLAVVG